MAMVFLSTQLEHPAQDHPEAPSVDPSEEVNILMKPKPVAHANKPEAERKPAPVAGKGDSVADLAKLEVKMRAAVQALKDKDTVMETAPEALEVCNKASCENEV